MRQIVGMIVGLLLLAGCQTQQAPTPCIDLQARWGEAVTVAPPENLQLLGVLPTTGEAQYTLHYDAELGNVWVWYFYDADLRYCGPYMWRLAE